MHNKCKVIAFFLPQFHEIKENNDWWGEGFTEWTHVKNAKPCFPGHKQPQKPVCGYYNLLDKDCIIAQTNLMHEYGIYGMAYYHYWFEGRLLLEKPVEMLRSNLDISQNYMFIWANHDWYKSLDGEKKLLIKQTYGSYEDWNNHYDYFAHYFNDQRYIKVNNRPVVGIYDPDKIANIDEMVAFWDKKAKQNGYNGIYIIKSCNHYKDIRRKITEDQGYLIRQPNVSFDYIVKYKHLLKGIFYFLNRHYLKWPCLRKFDYDDISSCERMVCNNCSENVFYTVCCGWDNTPRHGKRGTIITGFEVDKFKDSFSYVYDHSVTQNKEFLFVNAWNEWAEGMHLEPDEQYGYGVLEAIRDIVKEEII